MPKSETSKSPSTQEKISSPASSSSPSSPTNLSSSVSTSVFLADDHPAVRLALRSVIEEEEDIELCGEASSSSEAIRKIEKAEPEVAVIDISLKDAYGLDLLENLQAFIPETKALVYSMYEEEAYAMRAVQSGASGYLQKSESPNEIIEAIRVVARNEIYLSSHMSSQFLKRVAGRAEADSTDPAETLTDRELAVFQMLGLGYSREEIQERLSLARKTVETHRRRAKKKLGCDSINELYQEAVRWTDGQAFLPNSAGSRPKAKQVSSPKPGQVQS